MPSYDCKFRSSFNKLSPNVWIDSWSFCIQFYMIYILKMLNADKLSSTRDYSCQIICNNIFAQRKTFEAIFVMVTGIGIFHIWNRFEDLWQLISSKVNFTEFFFFVHISRSTFSRQSLECDINSRQQANFFHFFQKYIW